MEDITVTNLEGLYDDYTVALRITLSNGHQIAVASKVGLAELEPFFLMDVMGNSGEWIRTEIDHNEYLAYLELFKYPETAVVNLYMDKGHWDRS